MSVQQTFQSNLLQLPTFEMIFFFNFARCSAILCFENRLSVSKPSDTMLTIDESFSHDNASDQQKPQSAWKCESEKATQKLFRHRSTQKDHALHDWGERGNSTNWSQWRSHVSRRKYLQRIGCDNHRREREKKKSHHSPFVCSLNGKMSSANSTTVMRFAFVMWAHKLNRYLSECREMRCARLWSWALQFNRCCGAFRTLKQSYHGAKSAFDLTANITANS